MFLAAKWFRGCTGCAGKSSSDCPMLLVGGRNRPYDPGNTPLLQARRASRALPGEFELCLLPHSEKENPDGEDRAADLDPEGGVLQDVPGE
jgi:hypothetical protein